MRPSRQPRHRHRRPPSRPRFRHGRREQPVDSGTRGGWVGRAPAAERIREDDGHPCGADDPRPRRALGGRPQGNVRADLRRRHRSNVDSSSGSTIRSTCAPSRDDLLDSIVRELGGRTVKVHVDDLKNNVFIGRVFVRKGDPARSRSTPAPPTRLPSRSATRCPSSCHAGCWRSQACDPTTSTKRTTLRVPSASRNR